MAKRGYTRDTIRGGASDWDVSRPFSSSLRMLGAMISHPVRFFEVLPKVPDVRAPGLFLTFAALISAVVWLLLDGPLTALLALVLPVPVSLVLAGLWHLGTWGGRYGYVVTWRTLAYPFGFCLPLLAVPVLRWAAVVLAGAVLLSVGMATVREVSTLRATLVSAAITGVVLLAMWMLVAR